MSGNSGPRRSEMILLAFAAELDRRRDVIDTDDTLTKMVITLYLRAGGGHPRAIDCQLNHEQRFLDSCGPTSTPLGGYSSRSGPS